MKGRGTENCQGSKMIPHITSWWMHVIAHSEPIESKAPRVNSNITLWGLGDKYVSVQVH